ncbi:MAG: pyridoxal phosphate-dependent aminotransferase [Pseudomonadota bacterium]|nr:pyridoxal phosphate-dependent aminotransferase [Pseudomonadota bacterium]
MLKIAPELNDLGTETAFEILDKAEKLSKAGKRIINLGIGQPDFKTPEHIVEAAVKALRDGHHGYTLATGILELREAIVENLHTRHQVEISPDNIVVVPGGKPTMFFSILIFGGKGKEILYPNPGFPIYESLIKYTGARPIPIKLDESKGFSFSAEKVLSQITKKTSLIIINSPSNPTGGVINKDELDKFALGMEQHPNVAILSDEIYSRMIYDNAEQVTLLQYPRIRDQLIMLDGWSKTYAMTGWRLGYAVWPQKLVPLVTRLCINDHSCVNTATQFAGIAALKGPQIETQSMIKQFSTRREFISERLNSIPGFKCQKPKGAFYTFPNISQTGLTSARAQDLFLNEAGVAVIAGTSFGAWGEGYLRFSFANSLENIEEALARITDCIQ